MKTIHVVLTGGVGSRLWPLSRKTRPKQYLNIFGDNSLFELSIIRNRELTDKVMVVGNKSNHQLSLENLKKIKVNDFSTVVEATPRNTAPAITFAALNAQPEDILFITPSDHIIKSDDNYTKAVQEAIHLAKKDYLVTFGIHPTKPETGYGYIEYEGSDVLSFREKPNEETAESFLEQGNFLWNSGMFCFKAKVFLEELEKYQPEVLAASKHAWQNQKDGFLNLDDSLQIPSISVDYAVMEKSKKIKVVKSNFQWSDMGSFEAIYDYLVEEKHPVDEFGNMYIGKNKFTAFLGLENCIFIETDDANLILKKEMAQKVKHIYKDLEKNNPNLTL